MAEAEAAVFAFPVAGVERNSLDVQDFPFEEETELENLTVTGKIVGEVNIYECFQKFKYGAKGLGEMKYNELGEEIEIEGGFGGLIQAINQRFEDAYGEDGPYKFWGNANKWDARGAIQECLNLYNYGQFNNAQWLGGPFLKLFNAGNLLFTCVFPHVTGMSMCMINYNDQNKWTWNRGFYTSMCAKDQAYYPLNFKANADDGWKPEFYNNTFQGFQINYPYKSHKVKYDEGGEPIGKEAELCGDWILPFYLWNIGEEVTMYPVKTDNVNANDPTEKFTVNKLKIQQSKYDFAGNMGYKVKTLNIGKEKVDGHKDVYFMAEANKEIICAAKFREGIMIVNFATKEYPGDQGRRPQWNKNNAYRVQQFFARLVEKNIVTMFGGDDAVTSCLK